MAHLHQERCDGRHRGSCPFVVTHLGSYAADRRDTEDMDADMWAFPSVAARDQAAEQLCALLASQDAGWPYTWSAWRSSKAQCPVISLLFSRDGDADFSMTGWITPVLTRSGGKRRRTEDTTIISAHGGHLISVEEGLAIVCPESFRSRNPT
jgi:hypothetical protein